MITIEGIDPSMIANNIEPFRPVHPGEVIKDEIESRGISQRKLAKQMGVQYSQLNEVLNGKRALNAEYALLIEAVLDIPTAPLLRMQADYDMQVAKSNNTFMDKLKKVRKIAAIL